jgi:hypothetical protein
MKSRVLIGLGLILAIAAVAAHLATSHQVTKLTATVLAADTAGTDTGAPLAALKSYVQGHGGTHASFTLVGAYNRANAAAQAAANQQTASSQVYAAAQAACAGTADSITQARCNAQYLSQHLVAGQAPTNVTAPVLSSYQYNLTSAPVTLDLAGLLELMAFASILAGLVLLRRRHDG